MKLKTIPEVFNKFDLDSELKSKLESSDVLILPKDYYCINSDKEIGFPIIAIDIKKLFSQEGIDTKLLEDPNKKSQIYEEHAAEIVLPDIIFQNIDKIGPAIILLINYLKKRAGKDTKVKFNVLKKKTKTSELTTLSYEGPVEGIEKFKETLMVENES